MTNEEILLYALIGLFQIIIVVLIIEGIRQNKKSKRNPRIWPQQNATYHQWLQHYLSMCPHGNEHGTYQAYVRCAHDIARKAGDVRYKM